MTNTDRTTVIESKSVTFFRLFCEGRFRVPWHQRRYDWKPDHVLELLRDIDEAFGAGSQCYFLGMVIFVESARRKWHINDGQQRMVTLSLICACLYRVPATNMGFLNLTGGEVLVPLDGQHRLKAIQFAITGRDQTDRPIDDVKPCTELASEDVTIILVAYEPRKARKIFTKVNRYAKTTTTGQNYITDDDDVLAVLTREVANGLIGGRLAKFTSNTLRPKDAEFTTLAILYNCNEEIVRRTFPALLQRVWAD